VSAPNRVAPSRPAGPGKVFYPLYVDLAKASGASPRWNFHKYLIDRSGTQVHSFDTRVSPSDEKLVGAIEKLLAAP